MCEVLRRFPRFLKSSKVLKIWDLGESAIIQKPLGKVYFLNWLDVANTQIYLAENSKWLLFLD